MNGQVWTRVFYIFVCTVVAAPFLLVWHYWHEAKTKSWFWISRDSRNMYVDGTKTIVTASGIAVALLASSNISPAKTTNSIIAFSAKVAVVCLIACVCFSLLLIVALLRGFERAQSRYIEEERKRGNLGAITEGKLTSGELILILLPAGVALACFLAGFLFLGRIAFHY